VWKVIGREDELAERSETEWVAVFMVSGDELSGNNCFYWSLRKNDTFSNFADDVR